jgi:hypothetical protein
MTRNEILNIIKKSVDWNVIANYIHSTKRQLTDQTDRFISSEIRENIIEIASIGNLKYVNKDGNDLLLTYKNQPLKIESKFQSNGFLYTPKAIEKRSTVNNIVLLNIKSKNTPKKLPKDYSSVILCSEPHAFSIIFTEDILPFLQVTNTQIIAKDIPARYFHEIMNYQEFIIHDIEFNIQSEKEIFVKNTTQEFKTKYDLINGSYVSTIKVVPNKGNYMKIQNYKKDGSTKKAYQLLLRSNKKTFTSKDIQKLLETEGMSRSLEACGKYAYDLRKSKRFFCHGKVQKTKEIIYKFNTKHKDYLEFRAEFDNKLKNNTVVGNYEKSQKELDDDVDNYLTNNTTVVGNYEKSQKELDEMIAKITNSNKYTRNQKLSIFAKCAE